MWIVLAVAAGLVLLSNPGFRLGRRIPGSELGLARGPFPHNLVAHGQRGRVTAPRRSQPVDVLSAGPNETGSAAFDDERAKAAADARASALDPSRATFNGPLAQSIARGLAQIVGAFSLGFVAGPLGPLARTAIKIGIPRIAPTLPSTPSTMDEGGVGPSGLTVGQEAALRTDYSGMLAGMTRDQIAALGINPDVDPVTLDPATLDRQAVAVIQAREANISSIQTSLEARGFTAEAVSPGDNPDAAGSLDIGGGAFGGAEAGAQAGESGGGDFGGVV